MLRVLTRVCLLLLAVCMLGACRSELFGKLDETDANSVLDVLYTEGIPAYKVAGEAGSWRIEVDEELHQRALHVAREHGVPKQRFATMGELFKKEGLVSSPSEERLRYIFAVSQELASTLSQIDGVISARVHPVIPANDPLAEKVRPSSAAVFIKHKADADLQQMAPAIKTLVTRSIEGLTVDNVSLTFFAVPVQRPPVGNAAAAAAGPGSSSIVTALLAVLALCLALLSAAVGMKWWRRRQPSSPTPAQRARVQAQARQNAQFNAATAAATAGAAANANAGEPLTHA